MDSVSRWRIARLEAAQLWRTGAFVMTLAVAISLGVMNPVASSALAEAAAPVSAESGARPGPEILYWDPPRAPQLENTGVWKADPILVSGTSAYRRGEFLYQDFLYDDSGTYPDDTRYAGNAADFVEIRLKPLPNATAVRITYNSMLDPALVGTTIALGRSPAPVTMPHGARALMPAQVFVTVHGTTADAVDARTGKALGEVDATVDLERRQVDVRVPYAMFNPRGQKAVRIGAATGVWDTAAGGYTKSGTGAAFYNVAFRYNQPLSGLVTAAQNAALAAPGDLSAFFAEVDFTKLAARITDDSGVPKAGHTNRIKASHFETVQGRGSGSGGIVGDFACDDTPSGCTYQYAGQLQPYRLYVPEGPPPPDGWALVTNMHGCCVMDGGHNWASDTVWNSLAAAFDGAIVMSPLGRGASYFYWGQSGADVFENIADIMRRYPIDSSRIIGSGLSMGGCGTYKFGVQFPDFFSGIYPNVGCHASEAYVTAPGPPLGGQASDVKQMLASLRHVPIMALNAIADPLVPVNQKIPGTIEQERLGLRFDDWYFCDQPGLCFHAEYRGYTVDEFETWTSHLAPTPVDPPRITYVLNSVMNEPKYGLNSDHAYWLSGLTVRNTELDPPAGTVGKIDVFSHGFGVTDAPANVTNFSAGNGPGARTGAYHRYTKTWGAAPAIPVANQLDITATNVATVTIDPARARVDCDAQINVTSDGPLDITLLGCP